MKSTTKNLEEYKEHRATLAFKILLMRMESSQDKAKDQVEYSISMAEEFLKQADELPVDF